MKSTFLRPTIMLIGLTLAVGVAHAQDDNSILERLNLSPTQQEQVKQLREKFRTATETLRDDIRKLIDEEKQLKRASPSNETALRAKLKERADKEIELSLALTRFNEDLEAILTPAQKKMLEKIRAERNKK